MANITSLMSSSAVQGAYNRSKDLVVDPTEKPIKAEGQSFSEMLEKASTDAVSQVKETDAVLEAGLQGNIDTQQVVEAVMALEASVTVAISVRDKFVAAYQEVLRMPI